MCDVHLPGEGWREVVEGGGGGRWRREVAEGGGGGRWWMVGLLGRAAAAACGSARSTVCNNFAMWKEGEETLVTLLWSLCQVNAKITEIAVLSHHY